MAEGNEFVGIEEVAEIFDKSVESIRKYKNCGK